MPKFEGFMTNPADGILKVACYLACVAAISAVPGLRSFSVETTRMDERFVKLQLVGEKVMRMFVIHLGAPWASERVACCLLGQHATPVTIDTELE